MRRKLVVWFKEVGKEDVGLVGGKGANLGEMTAAGFPIPYGFIITSQSYFEFIRYNKLEERIRAILKDLDYEDSKALSSAGSQIRKLIRHADFPPKFLEKIYNYYLNLELEEQKTYKKLGILSELAGHLRKLIKHPWVAVRSSATAEDLPDASFAGQQETYLNIKGEHNLAVAVRNCFASLFTDRAIYYRQQKGFDHFKVGIAVVVQRMIQSDVSGIAFTVDPVTGNKNKMVIEAIFGLGEYIVGGKVTPDHYEVDKRSFVILKKQVKRQSVMLTRKGRSNIEVRLPVEKGRLQKLSDAQILELALIIKKIEEHYFFPQDIEWAVEKGNIYIVQSRPITTLKSQDQDQSALVVSGGKKPLVVGSPASPGVGVGPVKIVLSPSQINKVEVGDVLVAPQTNPDYVPAMKKAAAIVTEHGGRTSHAAIVSRELGVPAVVGAKNVLKILKNNQIITVVGSTGEIYDGALRIQESEKARKRIYRTKTKVYVNLAQPDMAAKVAKSDVDGVGLLRAEFIIANIGIHPKLAIQQGRESEYIQKLAREVLKFTRAFYPRPVVYRATDFKTNEYRNLKGGAKFEPVEENPMIGYRGAYRYIKDPVEFALELEMIKRLHKKGYDNLYLMIPFVRQPWELVEIKKIIAAKGLDQLKNFKLWMMVETPAVALALERFIDIGIDGVSIGTNDLTMLTLGVDRDNEKVSNLYDERSESVIFLLEQIVSKAKSFNITSSICGQAASDHPEIVRRLVQAGVTSVSVNPDVIDKTRKMIFSIEKELKGRRK